MKKKEQFNLVVTPLYRNNVTSDYCEHCGRFTEMIDEYLVKNGYSAGFKSYIIKPMQYPDGDTPFSNKIISPIRIPGETIGGIWINKKHVIEKITLNKDIFQLKSNDGKDSLIEQLNDMFKGKKLMFLA